MASRTSVKHDNERGEGEEALDDVVASPQRVREQEVERSPLLLAGNGARPGADREDQQEQRRHQREDLAVEVAGGAGDVELAAREQCAHGLG